MLYFTRILQYYNSPIYCIWCTEKKLFDPLNPCLKCSPLMSIHHWQPNAILPPPPLPANAVGPAQLCCILCANCPWWRSPQSKGICSLPSRISPSMGNGAIRTCVISSWWKFASCQWLGLWKGDRIMAAAHPAPLLLRNPVHMKTPLAETKDFIPKYSSASLQTQMVKGSREMRPTSIHHCFQQSGGSGPYISIYKAVKCPASVGCFLFHWKWCEREPL